MNEIKIIKNKINSIFIQKYIVELTKLSDLVANYANETLIAYFKNGAYDIESMAGIIYDVLEDEYDLGYDNHDADYVSPSKEEALETYKEDKSVFNAIRLVIANMVSVGIVPESFTIHNEW